MATRFEDKIAIVLSDDLLGWQRLNVTAFLVSGLTGARADLLGEPYADADGTPYLRMLGQPVVVLEADAATLAAAHGRAVARGVPTSIFTRELFTTGDDESNRAAVRAVPRDRLDVVGLGVVAPRNAADTIVKGARMHP